MKSLPLLLFLCLPPAFGDNQRGGTNHGEGYHSDPELSHSTTKDKHTLLRGTTPTDDPPQRQRSKRRKLRKSKNTLMMMGQPQHGPKINSRRQLAEDEPWSAMTATTFGGTTFGGAEAPPKNLNAELVPDYSDFTSWVPPQEDREDNNNGNGGIIDEDPTDQSIAEEETSIERPLYIDQEEMPEEQQQSEGMEDSQSPPTGTDTSEVEEENGEDQIEESEGRPGVFGRVVAAGESVVTSHRFCRITGICLGPDPTPTPTFPPTAAAPSPAPTQSPTANWENAPWAFKAVMWKKGTLLDAPPWWNSAVNSMFCRQLGYCFTPPQDVASTLPEFGDPYWAQRLCDMTAICLPTMAPSSQPTVTPIPTTAPSKAPTLPPTRAVSNFTPQPRASSFTPQPVATAAEEPAAAPEPEQVSLFGARPEDQPIRCRFSRHC